MVGRGNFQEKKQFMKAVLEGFKVGSENLQLAVVFYDSVAHVDIDFDEQLTKDQTSVAIDSLSERIASGDRYSEGLKKADELFGKVTRDDVKVSIHC